MRLWREIELAGNQIGKVILRTPIIYSDTLSKLTGKEIFLRWPAYPSGFGIPMDFYRAKRCLQGSIGILTEI